MKRDVERIADQLERSLKGEAWHGPSVLEALQGVDERKANERPIPNAHSIREIVSHLIAWMEEPARRLQGEGRDLPPEEDWPHESWAGLLDRLKAAHDALQKEIARLEDEALGSRVQGRKESIYVLLHGVIQHNLYHAGQIAILKKALP